MLERITHREMEVGVAAPFRVNNRPRLLIHGRIMGLEPEVKPQQEICEVHADAEAIGGRYLLVEAVELKHTPGLVRIIMNGPNIAGVDENGPLEYPEQLGTVFHAQYQINVATLIDKIGHRVASIVAAGAKSAHTPAADTVGATCIKAFLKGHHRRIAIRISDAEARVESHSIARIEVSGKGIVNLTLYILGILNAKHFINPVGMPACKDVG